MRILSMSIVVLCMLSAAHAQGSLFEETFAGGTAAHVWSPGFNGNRLEPEQRSGNPSGDGWVGKLGNDKSGGGVGASFASGVSFSDFIYEAKVYVPVDEATYYGIEFRVDTTGLTAGYQFIARFKPGGMVTPRLRFRVRTASNPAVPTTLYDWDGSLVPGGIPTTSGWHTLKVKAVSSHFWFYFDGQLLPGGPMFDNTFTEGSIGAYVWESAVSPLHLFIDDINVSSSTTDAEEEPTLPARCELAQNYPNPFGPGAFSAAMRSAIEYSLPATGPMRLSVFDALGREVRTLFAGTQSAGTHTAVFDAAGLPSGTYEYRLVAGGAASSRLAVVIR